MQHHNAVPHLASHTSESRDCPQISTNSTTWHGPGGSLLVSRSQDLRHLKNLKRFSKILELPGEQHEPQQKDALEWILTL